MKGRTPKDPTRAAVRRSIARRRLGQDATCSRCGESRPAALVQRSKPRICARCKRLEDGHRTIDDHHVAGQNNSPHTVPIPVNDHRAELSEAQMDWSRRVRENPEGDPLVAAVARLRGAADTIAYIVKWFIVTAADILECLADYMRQQHGSQWWRGTPVERFAPKA